MQYDLKTIRPPCQKRRYDFGFMNFETTHYNVQ